MNIEHPFADNSRAPFYVVTFPSNPSKGELASYVEAIRQFAREIDHKIVTVIDFSQIRITSSAQRKMLVELDKAIAPVARRYLAGSAIIAPSKMLKGLIKAAFWIQKPAYPYAVFQTRGEAETWAEGQLSAE